MSAEVRFSAQIFADNYLGRFRTFQALVSRRMEAAALLATDAASRKDKNELRARMKSARLGNL